MFSIFILKTKEKTNCFLMIPILNKVALNLQKYTEITAKKNLKTLKLYSTCVNKGKLRQHNYANSSMLWFNFILGSIFIFLCFCAW